MIPDRWCQAPGCEASIAFLAARAKYCSVKCRKAASRQQKRDRSRHRHGSLAGEPGYFPALDATRGYLHDWRPEPKTQILLGRAQQVLEMYHDQKPLTGRQIYYALIAQFGYPKGKKFTRACYDVLDNGRRSGQIKFSDIRDDGILGGGGWYTDYRQQLETWRLDANNFSLDVQQFQPVRVQVWCEAAGMQRQLARIADRYSVPVFSCGGFNSLTSIRQIVDSCLYDTTGPTVVLHLGDCDPSGYSIFQAVFEDVSAFLEADRIHPEQTFTAERVAIQFDQIEAYGLTSDLIETKDSRSLTWRQQGHTHKVELEALAPNTIADLLTAAIEKHLDLNVIEAVRAFEAEDRRTLIAGSDAAARAVESGQRGVRLHRHLDRGGAIELDERGVWRPRNERRPA